jgi:hypothetical protein
MKQQKAETVGDRIRATQEYKDRLVKGFTFEESVRTEGEYLAWWQWLVDTGMAWILEGWYGRVAKGMIDNGQIEG